MFNKIPVINRVATKEVPPKLMKGNGKPLVGVNPVTTNRFRVICKPSRQVIPKATFLPKESDASEEIRNPLQRNMANNSTTAQIPRNPNS